jgi:formylglycine-generating enzyme required for sulfatase activity
MDRKKAVQAMLGYLGFSMTEDNKDAEPREEIEDRLYRPEADKLRDKLERVARWKQSLRPFLDDLAERTGILGPHDGPDADWRFWHRTFREALAAERLEDLYTIEGEAKLLEHAAAVQGDESRWAEPYALLTGRLKEPDALVKSLVKANPTLGYRALATAQTLSEKTIDEILELSPDPDERGKVYQRLPELVGEGERTLGLIDRLRKQTRNGDDLFFLDLAVRQVAERWPEEAKAAETLRARFFDHISAPDDADLFHTINTPLDGPVSLWRAIPAGSFLMGSPKGEKDSYDDERPQHEVKITQSFGMAAVPVTNRQYRAFDQEHRWEPWEGVSEDELAHHPVVNVSWFAAVSFCRWLSASGLSGARLPTEAEWEYACRGGKQTAYWKGDHESDLAKVGWYGKNSEGRTHRVGEKKANPFGLYDVHGNVDEWTVSPWSDYSDHQARIEHGPRQEEGISPADLAEASGEGRVFRGGSFGSTAVRARSAYRSGVGPWIRNGLLGFRVVVPVAPEP